MDKIELILTCVNRASFLRETLPHNKSKFDNVIVVTSPSDYETQLICKQEGVDCIETNSFYKDGAPFNKGNAINVGIESVKYGDWIVLSDVDILFLPPHKRFFREESLNKEVLYGSNRIILESKSDYIDFLCQLALNPDSVDLNALQHEAKNQPGVGFFQMFYNRSNIVNAIRHIADRFPDNVFKDLIFPIVKDEAYPRECKVAGEVYPRFPHAGGSDAQFRHFFVQKNRLAVIGIPVVHLGKDGVDHSGGKNVVFS